MQGTAGHRVVIIGGRLRRALRRQGVAPQRRRDHARRPRAAPPVPAAALPGRDRDPVRGPDRGPAAGCPQTTPQRRVRAGRRRRRRASAHQVVAEPYTAVSSGRSSAAAAATAATCASMASGAPSRRLSAMVVRTSIGRCGTHPTRRSQASRSTSARSTPSTCTRPRSRSHVQLHPQVLQGRGRLRRQRGFEGGERLLPAFERQDPASSARMCRNSARRVRVGRACGSARRARHRWGRRRRRRRSASGAAPWDRSRSRRARTPRTPCAGSPTRPRWSSSLAPTGRTRRARSRTGRPRRPATRCAPGSAGAVRPPHVRQHLAAEPAARPPRRHRGQHPERRGTGRARPVAGRAPRQARHPGGRHGGAVSGGERQRIGLAGRCSPTGRCCCSTSRPHTSTRAPPPGCAPTCCAPRPGAPRSW